MTWITENPLWLCLIALFLIGCLGVLWYATRKAALLKVAAVLVGLMIAAVIVDRLVETDNEHLRRRIRELARVVRNNDVQRALTFVAPTAADCRARMENEMPKYRFSLCMVTSFQNVAINQNVYPPKARVEFLVFVHVDATKTHAYNGPADRRVVLTFDKLDDGQWYITDYAHSDTRQRAITNMIDQAIK